MTDNQLLKTITLKPRNLGLLFDGYITDGFFLIKNKEKSEKLLELYISKEYKWLKKIDKNNELMEYNEYFEKRYQSLQDLYSKWKPTIEFFEGLFEEYTKYNFSNIEIKEFKIVKKNEDEHIVLKLWTNKYYILNKFFYNIIEFVYKTPLNFVSKQYSEESNNITPIAVTNAQNWEILGFIFPLLETLTDEEYNNL